MLYIYLSIYVHYLVVCLSDQHHLECCAVSVALGLGVYEIIFSYTPVLRVLFIALTIQEEEKTY